MKDKSEIYKIKNMRQKLNRLNHLRLLQTNSYNFRPIALKRINASKKMASGIMQINYLP
jgi:hypothetical protein